MRVHISDSTEPIHEMEVQVQTFKEVSHLNIAPYTGYTAFTELSSSEYDNFHTGVIFLADDELCNSARNNKKSLQNPNTRK